MSAFDVYQASYKALSPEHRDLIGVDLIDEVRELFLMVRDLSGTYPITLRKALEWIDKKVSDDRYYEYIKKFYTRFTKENIWFTESTILDNKNKMFMRKKNLDNRLDVYFSIQGFEFWCMSQKTPKARAIQAYFSNMVHMHNNILHEENKNLRDENEKLNNASLISKKIAMFSEQLFRVDSELKKLKEIYDMKEIEKGSVYFIREVDSDRGFKIGFTTCDINDRLGQLQTGSKQELECYRSVNKQEPSKYEKFLHDCFDSKHIRGEWYDLTVTEVDNFVAFLKS